MKVVLILVDGMRPDAISDLPEARDMLENSSVCLKGTTVLPSVTLPCHMSLFHSVTPERHGTTTNVYMPQVRPVMGLCEQLGDNKKHCAFFYNWEELRDLSRPGYLDFSYFCSGYGHGFEESNLAVTENEIEYIVKHSPDFSFVYLGWVDEAGHAYTWMSDEYMTAVHSSWDCINRIRKSLGDEYCVIVTADHGGHARMHGTDMPEDMTIPIILEGKPFEKGKIIENADIIDIAPTVAKLLDTEPNDTWEGKSLI